MQVSRVGTEVVEMETKTSEGSIAFPQVKVQKANYPVKKGEVFEKEKFKTEERMLP